MIKAFSLGVAAVATVLVLNLALAADEPDPMQAEFDRVQTLADGGDTSAMECLAHMYWFGMGTAMNRSKTAELLQRAVAKGDKSAQASIREVELLQAGPDAAAKLQTLEAAAGKGDARDQATLGGLYFAGFGTLLPQDTAKSFYWFGKAAKAGDADADMNLASFYIHGWAARRDAPKAAALLARQLQQFQRHQQQLSCASFYYLMVDGIVQAHLQYPADVALDKVRGVVGLRLRFKDDRLSSVKLSYPSGSPQLDAAALQAVKDSAFPLPPAIYASGLAPMEFYLYFKSDAADPAFYSGFTGDIRRAIYAAARPPKELLIHGTQGSGKVVMHFHYLDGKIMGLETVTSSGDHALDDATAQAVTTTTLPAMPPQYRGKSLEFWMTFDYTSELGLVDQDGKPKDDFNHAYNSGEYDAFAAAMKKAVADKVSYPAAAGAAGAAPEQKVGVEFDYLDGAPSDIVVTSSGVADAFKQEAVTAVQEAAFPPTPQVYAGKSLHMRLILDFRNPEPAPVVSTVPVAALGTVLAPSNATGHGP